jgi:hypothetical protein
MALLGSTSLTRASADSTSIAARAEFNSLFHSVIRRLQTKAVALLNKSLPVPKHRRTVRLHSVTENVRIAHLNRVKIAKPTVSFTKLGSNNIHHATQPSTDNFFSST